MDFFYCCSVILDGINLNIEHGSGDKYPLFVKTLHDLMLTDASRYYVITSTPQCPFPDRFMEKTLTEQGHLIKDVYVQFYNNYCTPADRFFSEIFQKWIELARNKKMNVYIGLSGHTNTTIDPSFYMEHEDVEKLYKVCYS